MPEVGKTRVDSSIQNSILTTAQREFLQSNIKNTDKSTTTRARARERTREGLRDFHILAYDLEDRDREMIFKGGANTPGYKELQHDVESAIAFMYAGLGGEAGFRAPLRRGVSQGELILGNIKGPAQVDPRFAVDFLPYIEHRETVEAIKSGEWDRLSSKALLWFVRVAQETGAIDFEQMYKEVELRETILEENDSENKSE